MFGKKKYVVWFDAEQSEVFFGKLIHTTKDYYGNPHTYLIDSCTGDIAVKPEQVLYIGPEDKIPHGLLRLNNAYQCKFIRMEERMKKLEESHRLLVETLKSIRDILQESKYDGKSKVNNCTCSGGCSGDCEPSCEDLLQESGKRQAGNERKFHKKHN